MVEDPIYSNRSTTNVDLDKKERIKISKQSTYKVVKINTVSFEKETFRLSELKLWNSLPKDTKQAWGLEAKIKSVNFDQYLCYHAEN